MYELMIYSGTNKIAEFKLDRFEDACEVEKVATKMGYDVLWKFTEEV